MNWPRSGVSALIPALLAAACGSSSGGPTPASAALQVIPQNTAYVVGVNRLSVALIDKDQKPVNGATTTSFEIQGARGVFERGPLEDIGPQYGRIPVYVGAARFLQVGEYRLVVHATLPGGGADSGAAVITVVDRSPEVAVGAHVPPLSQPIAGGPGVKLSDIDSGVPPDEWHTSTIAGGLAQHRPMILYFGQPGFCKSRTCGPTVQVLQDVCHQYCDRFLFEHIETNYPAGPDETTRRNPAFEAFGLQSEPWIYLVNADGVVSDRFEGPVTAAQLRAAAEGTLAGRVPAVDILLPR
ncbi:MAG: TlpA family protein disulfide reductase [Candidatus Dormibacteria bacterium]